MREDGGGRRVMSNRSAMEMSLNIRIKWDMQEKEAWATSLQWKEMRT